MHIRKWKKFRLSKYLFPTRIPMSGSGREEARKALQDMLGRPVDHMQETDTRFEWVFMEPLPVRKVS